MCRILGVPYSGYYDWRDPLPNMRMTANAMLPGDIHRIQARKATAAVAVVLSG